jgi:hypothetical protein
MSPVTGRYVLGCLAVIALCAFGVLRFATAEDNALSAFLKRVATDQPSFKWDSTSTVRGNFDGKQQSFAIVGYADRLGNADGRVMVAVGQQTASHSVSIQYLEFGISGARQDAICTAPAKLLISPLTCHTEAVGDLPGCEAAPGVSGLRLADNECDSIHMYWSHTANRMVWWRL